MIELRVGTNTLSETQYKKIQLKADYFDTSLRNVKYIHVDYTGKLW